MKGFCSIIIIIFLGVNLMFAQSTNDIDSSNLGAFNFFPKSGTHDVKPNPTEISLTYVDDFNLSIATSGSFITTWQTTVENETITIPTIGGGYNYNVDWGDSMTNTAQTGNVSHTYATPGTHTVLITGMFPRIHFNNVGDKDKIISVEQWGTIQWGTSLGRAFKGCTNLVINAADAPNLSNTTTLAGMFDGATSMNSPIGNWNVSTIENMDGMFRNTPFNQDISGWNVNSVSVFSFMFDDAAAFNQDISGWAIRTDVPVSMASMFRGATAFNQNLGGWDVSSVTNMIGMFERCSNFNGNIGIWGVKTSTVENMAFLFKDATSFNDDISTWNTDSVTDMVNMFSNATVFNQEIGGWNVSNVTVMISMFEDATNFNGNISGWDISNVEEMFAMFSGAENFNQPIGSWGIKTANVFDFGLMFKGATAFNQDISSWSTGASIYFDEMFSGASSFNQPIGNWDVTGAEFMAFAFENATAFNQDLSGWNISNVIDVFGMFNGVTLSTVNYDSLLQAWSALPLQAGLQFSGGTSQYCNGATARTSIINDFGWNISDGGIELGCTTALCTTTTTYTAAGWAGGIAPTIDSQVHITSNYDTDINGSIDGCSLLIDAGVTVIIRSEDYINILGSITNNGNLLIEHQGSIVQSASNAQAINNGTIDVAITTPALNGRDFMLLSSPMSQETREDVFLGAMRVRNHSTSNFSPNSAVEATSPGAGNWIDEEGDDWANHIGSLSVGEGYQVIPSLDVLPMPPYTNYTYNFTQGTLNTGTINYVAEFNADQNSSPNIVGNPYASAIDAEDFINQNSTIVDAVYFWEHITSPTAVIPGPYAVDYSMEDISTYNLTGGIGAASSPATTEPNGRIASAQGFGFKALESGSVSFTNTMRRKTGNTTLRAPSLEKDRIWLTLSSEQYPVNSMILVGFLDQASPQIDRGYDTQRLATIVSFYSHPVVGEEVLSIQAREAFAIDKKVQVGFSTLVDETTNYKIAINDVLGNSIENETVYLIDHTTDRLINLSETSYQFEASKGNYPKRFTLQFTSKEVLETTENELQNIVLYPNPTTGIVTIQSEFEFIEHLKVFDVLGRLVQEKINVHAKEVLLDISKESSGVYFVEIESPTQKTIKKVIKTQ